MTFFLLLFSNCQVVSYICIISAV